MPIRFRCPHCQQFLGISRRKAGSAVRCPTCKEQVLVPPGDEDAPPPEALAPPVFERSDFEAYLHAADEPRTPPSAPAASAAPAVHLPRTFDDDHPPAPFPVIPPAPSPSVPSLPPPGIVLSPARVTVLTVLGIVLLALSFGLGLLVGRLL